MKKQPKFEKDKWYYLKFIDHGLNINYEGDLKEIALEFSGKYLGESENKYCYVFYATICSWEEKSDTFQVAKGTIVDYREMVFKND
ncbi:hypothetical protein LCGC14_0495340 [marine sediment metagenome]|uniref:Uncharacterized protein n=1 Tax=marine sediment metagenome TaxID=412755 RepID=A0A0F9SNZ1_9ZZZZ